jgi:hypothetical protein
VDSGSLSFSEDGRYIFRGDEECFHIGHFYDGRHSAAKKLSIENRG